MIIYILQNLEKLPIMMIYSILNKFTILQIN